MQYWMYAATRWSNIKWGAGHHWPPDWRRSCLQRGWSLNSQLHRCRFGFVRDQWDFGNEAAKSANSNSRNYVHCTGQVFAQIPIQDQAMHRHSISFKRRPLSIKQSPAKPAGKSACDDSPSLSVISQRELDSTGFYWSTNHMLTKRWRVSSLDDCPLQDLEQDFVKFCCNADDRLKCCFNDFIEKFTKWTCGAVALKTVN